MFLDASSITSQISCTLEQVLCYGDGTTRRLFFSTAGDLQEFVNPSGSKWVRQSKSSWRVFSRDNREIGSSPIIAQVRLEKDLALIVEQNIPHKFSFSQTPDGNYVAEFEHQNLELWNAKELTKTEFWSSGEIVRRQYTREPNGTLSCLSVFLTENGELEELDSTGEKNFIHPI